MAPTMKFAFVLRENRKKSVIASFSLIAYFLWSFQELTVRLTSCRLSKIKKYRLEKWWSISFLNFKTMILPILFLWPFRA